MERDWTGNSKATFSTLGASSHSTREREEWDFYATPAVAVEKLLERETFSPRVWECACGAGHISEILKDHGHEVFCSDIADRMDNAIVDFLQVEYTTLSDYDIITNPPYRYAQEFVEKALEILPHGFKCAFLLRLQFLEGIKRKRLFEYNPPKTVYVFSKRIQCCINGEFDKYKGVGSAIAYAWFVWQKGYKGDTVIKWI